jgi:hypothetical protein
VPDRQLQGFEISTAVDSSGSGVPFRLVRYRSFTEGLMPSTVKYPVLVVKRSLVWTIAERRLTILATARTDVPE